MKHLIAVCLILTAAVWPVINQSQMEGIFTDSRDKHVYK